MTMNNLQFIAQMTLDNLQIIALILVFFIFAVVFVLGSKILVMIDVFGWEKTKELLKDDKFEFGRNINKKLEAALEEEIQKQNGTEKGAE